MAGPTADAGDTPGAAPPTRALRLAHRGDHRREPENSLAAIRAAVANRSLDGVEFDVQAARDGTPILLHDETLARTHGRRERPSALDVATLRQIGVPTLDDILAAIPDDRFLDVELKTDVVDAVAEALVARAGRGAPLVVSSFEPSILEAIAAAAPDLERWLNAEALDRDALAVARALGATAVSARLSTIDERTTGLARDAGLAVAAWTAIRPTEVARLEALGIIAVCVEGAAVAA